MPVYANFARTGDWMRSSSRYLQEVIDDESGVNVFVYAGDAVRIKHYLAHLYCVLFLLFVKSGADGKTF